MRVLERDKQYRDVQHHCPCEDAAECSEESDQSHGGPGLKGNPHMHAVPDHVQQIPRFHFKPAHRYIIEPLDISIRLTIPREPSQSTSSNKKPQTPSSTGTSGGSSTDSARDSCGFVASDPSISERSEEADERPSIAIEAIVGCEVILMFSNPLVHVRVLRIHRTNL